MTRIVAYLEISDTAKIGIDRDVEAFSMTIGQWRIVVGCDELIVAPDGPYPPSERAVLRVPVEPKL